MKWLTLCISALLFMSANSSPASGNETVHESIVMLKVSDDDSSKCYGVITSSNIIITIASCLGNLISSEHKTILGVYSLSGIEYGVASISNVKEREKNYDDNSLKFQSIFFDSKEGLNFKGFSIPPEENEDLEQSFSYILDSSGEKIASPLTTGSCSGVSCSLSGSNSDYEVFIPSLPLLNSHGDICMVLDESTCLKITKSSWIQATTEAHSPPACELVTETIDIDEISYDAYFYKCDVCVGQYDSLSSKTLPDCSKGDWNKACEFLKGTTPSKFDCDYYDGYVQLMMLYTLTGIFAATVVGVMIVWGVCVVREKCSKKSAYQEI